MIQSFVMLSYFVRVRPFESAIENFLQVFNEVVVITSIAHVFAFSDGLGVTPNGKLGAGWSFVFFVVAQIGVNSVLYFGVTSYDAYLALKRMIATVKQKLRVKHQVKIEQDAKNSMPNLELEEEKELPQISER